MRFGMLARRGMKRRISMGMLARGGMRPGMILGMLAKRGDDVEDVIIGGG